MYQSKLILLIEQLLSNAPQYGLTRRQQQNRLRRFVTSPYFTYDRDKNILPLFDYMVKYLPNLNHKALQKAKVFKSLFPNRTFDEKGQQDLRRCMTDLVAIIEQFICVHDSGSKTEIRYHLPLLRFHLDNPLSQENHFQQLWNELYGIHEQQHLRNTDFYENELLLQQTWHTHLSLKPFDFEAIAQQINHLNETLNILVIIQKLNYFCQYLTLKQSVNVGVSLDISDHFIDSIKTGRYLDIPAVDLYFTAFCLLSDNSNPTPHFRKLKKLLTQHSQIVTLQELKNFYTYAENYCSVQINQGKTEFHTDLLDLYDEQLQSGIIFIEGLIDIRKFKNILTLALRLQRYDYAQGFIQHHQERINEKYRDEVYQYSMAALFFEQRNFDAVLHHLHHAEQDKRFYNIFYRLDSQKLFIKTYYECGELRLLEAKINAFATFCRNNDSVAPSVLQANLNFIRIMRKLHHIREAQQWEDIDHKIDKHKREIQHILLQENLIAERTWLNEKINQLD